MGEYIIIAWRNIWRNKKRSLITISSIFFATFLAIIMRSFQLGSYDSMINSVVEMFSGYIQIEYKDFPNEQIIDNSIVYSEDLIGEIKSIENVSTVVPRLSSFSFASSAAQTKGVMFTGIDPELENEMTKIKEQIVKTQITKKAVKNIENEDVPPAIIERLKKYIGNHYSRDKILKFDLELTDEESEKYFDIIKKHTVYKSDFLRQNDKGILLADGLAKYLKLNTGDTLVLLGQGYHGCSAEGKFLIRGVIKIPNPMLNNRMVYGSLKTVQDYFSAYEIADSLQDTTFLLSSYAINLHKKGDDDIYETRDKIIELINNDDYIVRGWKEANKTLANQIKSDNESGKMMLGILYIVIAFGVFGTVLMLIAERKREMGVMIAIGMRKFKLAIIITLEMIFISFTALFFGILASVPIVAVGHLNPIRLRGDMAEMMANYGMEPELPFAWFDTYYLDQVYVVLIIVLLVMIYPVITVMRLKIINALRA